MAVASEPARYVLKGFDDDLEGRVVQFVHSLPTDVPISSLCSVVPSEHYSLACGHVYCTLCFLGTVQKQPSYLRCPLDAKTFRPRKALLSGVTAAEALRDLVSYCWNKEHGCIYAGTLGAMSVHFGECAFYWVTCSVCSAAVLRIDLVKHVEDVHPRSRRSRQYEPAALFEDDQAGADDQPVVDGASKHIYRSGEKVPTHWALRVHRSDEHLRALFETAAWKPTEDLKEHNLKMFLKVFDGIDAIKEHLVNISEGLRVTPLPQPATKGVSAAVSLWPRVHQEENIWVVSRYSKLPVGVHYIESPFFLIAPGYKVQLTVCIDGVTLIELSVSVNLRRGDGEQAWPFRGTCSFTLFDTSERDGDVTSSYAPSELFASAVTPPLSDESEVVISGWLNIAKMDRSFFEQHYLKDDAFSIGFSANYAL